MCRSYRSHHHYAPRRDPHFVHDPNTRASDADRERVADLLRAHAGEGRLEPDELEQRLEAAYAARTLGDLAPLTTDLPPLDEQRRAREPSGWAWARPWPSVLLLIAIVAIVALVSVAVGHLVLWLAIPLFFVFRHRPLAPRWR